MTKRTDPLIARSAALERKYCRRCHEALDPHAGAKALRWPICFTCWDRIGRPPLQTLLDRYQAAGGFGPATVTHRES